MSKEEETVKKTTKNTKKVETNQDTNDIKTKVKKKKITDDLSVPVYNNRPNPLYLETKDGAITREWSDYRDVEDFTIRELRKVKNQVRSFFSERMFVIGDTDEFTAYEIYKYLGVDKYYDKVTIDIDDIFDKSTEELESLIPTLNDAVKKMLSVKASELVKNGELDSVKKRKALETLLNIELYSD